MNRVLTTLSPVSTEVDVCTYDWPAPTQVLDEPVSTRSESGHNS